MDWLRNWIEWRGSLPPSQLNNPTHHLDRISRPPGSGGGGGGTGAVKTKKDALAELRRDFARKLKAAKVAGDAGMETVYGWVFVGVCGWGWVIMGDQKQRVMSRGTHLST